MIKPSLLLALLLVSNNASAAELRISGEELAGYIQRAFDGTRIRLHHDDSAPASFVQFGPNLQGQKFAFRVPATDVSLGFAGKGRYTIHDVNSDPDHLLTTSQGKVRFGQNIKVAASPNTFVLTLRFEDEGTELKGIPTGRIEDFPDGTIPDIQIDDVFVQILLTPVNDPVTRSVSFPPAVVNFYGDIQAQGLAGFSIWGIEVDLLDEITDYKVLIKESIEREVTKLINQNLRHVVANVTREVRRRAAAVGVVVTGMRFEGTTLVVAGAPPNQR